MPDHAILVFEIGGHFILDLDVVIFTERRKPRHPLGHPYKPLAQVKAVWALIQQDAAVFPFPGSAPTAVVLVALGPKPVGDNPGSTHPWRSIALILRQNP